MGAVPATRTCHCVFCVLYPGDSAMKVHMPVRSPIIAHLPLSSALEVISRRIRLFVRGPHDGALHAAFRRCP